MIKYYFDHHEEEDIKKMEFGMRMIRASRTVFSRQIQESVEIQAQKNRHHLLNSRSEYNRCALPRLTAKMGDEAYDKMEKIKREEKVAEQELERKIRNMKVAQIKGRREEPGKLGQPAEKKRKLTIGEHKRVMKPAQRPENRKEDTKETEEKRFEEVKNFPVFNTKKKIKIERLGTEENSKIEQVEEKQEPEKKDWEEELREKECRREKEEKERREKKRLRKHRELKRVMNSLNCAEKY